jgi:putative redox protein
MKTRSFYIKGPKKDLSAVIHEPPSASDHVFVMCHGFRGSKEGGGRAAALAEQAAGLGLNVLRFDFSPTGILTEQIAEIQAVVAYCRTAVAPRIILLGRSMGGSAALAYTARYGDIAALCLWSTPWNLVQTFQLALGEGYGQLAKGETLEVADEFGKLVLSPAFIHDFANHDLLASAHKIAGTPLLIVHGSADAIVPVNQAETLYSRAGQPKKLVIIPDGDHQFLQHHQNASAAVLSWLQDGLCADGI